MNEVETNSEFNSIANVLKKNLVEKGKDIPDLDFSD